MIQKILSCVLVISIAIMGCFSASFALEDGAKIIFSDCEHKDGDQTATMQVGDKLRIAECSIVKGDGVASSYVDINIRRAWSSNENVVKPMFKKYSSTSLDCYVTAISPGTADVKFIVAYQTITGSYAESEFTVKVTVEKPFQPLEFTIDAPERIDVNLTPLSAKKVASAVNEHSTSVSTSATIVGFAIGGVGLLASFATGGSSIALAASALGFLTGGVGVASTAVNAYNKDKNSDAIDWEPYPAKVRVTIKNPNSYAIYGVFFEIEETNSGGTVGTIFAENLFDSIRKDNIVIPAKSTRTFTFEIQPEILYGYQNYNSTFTLSTSYKNPDTKEYINTQHSDTTEVHSHLKDDYAEKHYPVVDTVDQNTQLGFQSNLPASAPTKIITVQCPVNVNILDAGGNVLATIESYDEEVFAADGIAAYAIDDAKAVVIDHEYLDSYRISIDAVGDGSMTITSVDILDDGTYAISHHAEVPLTAGDTFSADISDTSVTRIYSGAGEEITADLVLNRETVASMLVEAGYSEAWQASALEAILRGLVTPGLAENPQNATTYEEYAAALLAMLENFIGVGAGYYAEYYSEALGRTDLTAMDILAELGVTGMADFSGDINAPITRGDMAIMTTSMLENLCIEYAFDEVEWTDVTDGNIAWSAGFMYHIGAMYCETEGAFAPAGTITHEESIHVLYMLWTYLQDPQLPPEIDPATEYADAEIIKGVQTALNELGYDCGTPDGVAGKNTAAAITAFQTDMEITVTGTITEETLIYLGWMGYDIPR